ncbi:MAG: DUF3137 domain-containing protein [Pseudomonadota bacterium]
MAQDNSEALRAFDRHVAPQLLRLEKDREAALAQMASRRWPAIVGTIAVTLGGAGLGYIFDFAFQAMLFAGVLGGMGLWIWYGAPGGAFEEVQRTAVMTAICDQIGDLRYLRKVEDRSFDLDPFREAKVIPSHSSRELEDLISGTYRGADFMLVEAKLTRRSGKNNRSTVFKGLLLRISLPRRVISGPVIITKDYGSMLGLMNTMAGWMTPGSRVAIPHEAFEAAYEVYAGDSDEALAVITPQFVENFLQLPDVLGSDKLLAAFENSSFLLSAQDTSPFLGAFSVNVSMQELRDVFVQTHAETRIIHRVIDQLLEGDRYAPNASSFDRYSSRSDRYGSSNA